MSDDQPDAATPDVTTPDVPILIETLREPRTVGVYDVGDMWDLPLPNTQERIDAAERLAAAGAVEAFGPIEELFSAQVLQLDGMHGSYPEVFEGPPNRHRLKGAETAADHPFDEGNVDVAADVRRLGHALAELGGEARFAAAMTDHVLPALAAAQEDHARVWGGGTIRQEIRHARAQVNALLVDEFGSIGDWARTLAGASAEPDRATACDSAAQDRAVAQQRAELRREWDIEAQRRSGHLCIKCGKPLGVMDRLRRRLRHSGCVHFQE